MVEMYPEGERLRSAPGERDNGAERCGSCSPEVGAGRRKAGDGAVDFANARRHIVNMFLRFSLNEIIFCFQ